MQITTCLLVSCNQSGAAAYEHLYFDLELFEPDLPLQFLSYLSPTHGLSNSELDYLWEKSQNLDSLGSLFLGVIASFGKHTPTYRSRVKPFNSLISSFDYCTRQKLGCKFILGIIYLWKFNIKETKFQNKYLDITRFNSIILIICQWSNVWNMRN